MFTQEDCEQLRCYEDVQKMHWRDFEWLCKYILHHHGFRYVRVTDALADGGVDLIAYQKQVKHYVQCKHQMAGYHGVQAVEPIRALGGCMLRDGVKSGIFMSVLPYDRTDYTEADKMGIWLIGAAEIDRYLCEMNEEYRPLEAR